MKKNKKKKFFSKKRFFLKISVLILSLFSLIGITYAINIIGDYIATQTANGIGTNSNKITFSKHKTTYYINKDNDNIIIGDKLRGYYYDNIYGFFRLDWNQNEDKNVYINDGPNNIGGCNEAYSFTGSAYSKYMGKMKFYYDSNNFVYFCKTDLKIYGTGYTDNLGKQIFDGIKINLIEKEEIEKITDNEGILDDNKYIEDNNSIKTDYNWNNNSIGGGDKYEIEKSDIKELEGDVFWIIK